MRFVGLLVLGGCIVGDGSPTTDLDVDADGDRAPASVDCDDGDATVYPGATEVCEDGVDNDCDGIIDDSGIGARNYYADEDRDGYGDPLRTEFACPSAAPEGWSEQSGDCDDTNSEVFPGALEVCDGLDQNCDGSVDEGLDLTPYWIDGDGDGFGASNQPSELLCESRDGWVTNGDDCDDTRDDVLPGAIDICDTLDNDCDGAADNSAVASVGTTLHFTLGAAVDAATALASPVVDVCAGTHAAGASIRVEDLEQVTVRGMGRAATTIEISANQEWLSLDPSSVVELRDVRVVATGFATALARVRDGARLRLEDVDVGAFPQYAVQAVDVETTARLEVVRSTFVGTDTALVIDGAVDAVLEDTTFQDNGTPNASPVVLVTSSDDHAPTFTCTGCTFVNNAAREGILRLVAAPGRPEVLATLIDTRFDGFEGTDRGAIVAIGSRVAGQNLQIQGGVGFPTLGGAIYAERSTIVGATIDDCTSSNGGGVHATDSVVENVTVTNSDAGRAGGVYLIASRLVGSTIQGNSATEGGGVYLRATATGSRISTSTIAENHASVEGGGVFADGDTGRSLIDPATVIARNTTGGTGPGMHVDGGRVESEADFGLAGDPLTDNGEYDVSYTNESGEVEEVDVHNEEWLYTDGEFQFL